MNATWALLPFLALWVLGLCSCAPDTGRRIMPLGDSLTDGLTVPGGYRIRLAELLVADGWDTNFVGSQINGPRALDDRHHEGHSGFTIDELSDSAQRWLTRSQPRVVLLLAGTNDLLQERADGAPERLGRLIDQVLTVRPDARVVVGTLPPIDDPELEAEVLRFNAALPDLVAARVAGGRDVRLADLHARISTAQLEDGVHLNRDGYDRMADVWYEILGPLLLDLAREDADGGSTEE